MKALILLGDPGMGKSTVLSEQESISGKMQHDSSQKYLFLNLRSYKTDSRLADDLLKSSTFKEWLAGTHTLHLFLDSLDEGLLSINTLAAFFADEFKKIPSERLYLRIACRTVEWPDLLENALQDWLGKDVVQHYVLAPLRKKDVEEAARVSGLGADHFLIQVESSAVVPLAIKPVTLKFLLSVYRKQGSLPSSQSTLYLEGCRLLAAEPSDSRRAAGYQGELTAGQRMAVAARIAAGMIFGNRNAIYLGTNPAEAPDEDVTLPELSGGTESDDGVRFNLGEKEIQETLDTGLFSTAGPNRIGWGHQTYAEFLAAWYLKKHDISISQIKSLITHPNDLAGKIVPQLSETAAWLAGMIPEIFQAIVQAEPDLLLRSEVATGDSPRRATLAEALLQLYENEHVFDRDRDHYKNLAHPGLADQLRPYVADNTKGIIVRRVAIDIAESCNTQSLNEALLAVALDTSDNLQTRVQAASAIGGIGDDETKKKLKPLAFSVNPDDLQDELKGSVLRALWPSLITAQELFSLLKPAKSERFAGIYRVFLSSEIVAHLAPQDLIPALEFVTNLEQPRDELDSSLESLMDGVARLAWDNMNVPGVTEGLARFVASRLKHHDNLVQGPSGERDPLFFTQEQNKRRCLLEAVFSVAENETESDIDWLDFSDPPLVLLEDFEWLISCLDRFSNKKEQKAIGHILQHIFMRNNIRQLELIYDACNRHPVIAEIFNWVWQPILLDSDQAKEWKRQHQRQQMLNRRRDRPVLTPSPAERVIAALEKCEALDSAEWWQLLRELSLEANATNYDSAFEWDLMKLPGWMSAEPTIRERIVLVTEKFILCHAPNSADWLGTGQWKTSVLSDYSALAFLLQTKPGVLHGLSSTQMEKWCPIIVSFPFLHNDRDRAVRDDLLKIAYDKSPNVVLEVAKILIDKEIRTGERIGTATELNTIWDNQIANFLLQYAKSNETKPKAMGSLLSVLFAHDNTAEARSFAESLLCLPPPQAEPDRTRAVVAAQTLILDTPDSGWETVWPAIHQDEDFGKEVILGICSDYASIGLRLNEGQLADLYVFLRRHFETPQHPSGEAYYCGPLDNVDMWRNAIIQVLIHRGNFRACEAIRKLQQEFPELDWLKSVQADAETETRRVTWVPARPQDIVKLANYSELRLVQSGDQLLQVLVESLERFQAQLQGETPEAQFLWDNISNSDAKPKDENTFADYIKIYLEKDLKQRGIVLNREVRIHRGQRTDI
ncbi:MAG: hypothetical protein KC588_11620, partial [Nitrospira sp.]|nr:hypothetical protein [Nitrospira sp.]